MVIPEAYCYTWMRAGLNPSESSERIHDLGAVQQLLDKHLVIWKAAQDSCFLTQLDGRR